MEEYRVALHAAEQALAELPDSGFCQTARGVARYRLGQFDEAVAALVLADENHVKKYGRGIPPDVAYLAMAHHQLDNEAEARAALERCRELIQLQGEDQFEKDNLEYLAEAEQLIEPGGDGASSRGE